MIKFFRKIRQNMIKENRTSKYLLYAIGEIVLVVIGILIALQLNTLKEDNITKKTERVVLSNILEEIQLDTLDVGFNLTYHQLSLANEGKLLKLLSSKSNAAVDSIDYAAALGYPLISALNKATYNALSNNNPDLISNQNLKKLIYRHYDFFYTALLEAENKSNSFKIYDKLLPFFQKNFRVINSKSTFNLAIGNSSDYFNDNYKRNKLYPKNIDRLKENDEFKVALSEVIFLRRILISVYEEVLSRIKELEREINKELLKTK
jgi:hypothetical protein